MSFDLLGELVYLRTYARWREADGRREHWPETVDRYVAFMRTKLGSDALSSTEWTDVRAAILNLEVMPSMRLLQFAGEAVARQNACAYNCAFCVVDELRAFREIMYLLLCGTGVGFSVEERFVRRLPLVMRRPVGPAPETHVVADSREGWADALDHGLWCWFNGHDRVDFDLTNVRPAGSPLRTSGGRSSGPEPLRRLLDAAAAIVRGAVARMPTATDGVALRPIDVHDLVCIIGECVVAGGVRRSALISLSDLNDAEMRNAKTGRFFDEHPQRWVANNSAVYTKRPSDDVLLTEWLALTRSGTGERGLFVRDNVERALPARRRAVNPPDTEYGTNPCGEVVLCDRQFCNLTEVVARPTDTLDTLERKVRVAALLGTYQATLTHLPYLSARWRENAERERLLGVSITGQWDCAVVREAANLQRLREVAHAANAEYAYRFGICVATAVTCVKPSGTVSQMVNAACGMHARFAPFYVRRVRMSARDALCGLLRNRPGVPCYPEVGQTEASADTFVVELPVASPIGAVCQSQLGAIDQLEYWLRVRENFTDHNPSVTVMVGPDEWIPVLGWIHAHWDRLAGLAFLPRNDHVYPLAPFEQISAAEHARRIDALDGLRSLASELAMAEHTDTQERQTTWACGGRDEDCG